MFHFIVSEHVVFKILNRVSNEDACFVPLTPFRTFKNTGPRERPPQGVAYHYLQIDLGAVFILISCIISCLTTFYNIHHRFMLQSKNFSRENYFGFDDTISIIPTVVFTQAGEIDLRRRPYFSNPKPLFTLFKFRCRLAA